ncbi:S41 family peptidase [Prosthecobacter sp.]|uniref:S41 family peptidase n=1 Tax=Prosthecobacter sp. TaxID=1965333 RepID=UPI002486E8ED|nr:S41 family peptidase [Prosthecobacter sp.]MDI1313678.1 S41 family peptidase [Prosthecobacter sp.]
MRRLALILTFTTSSVFAVSGTEQPKEVSQAGIQTAFRILQKEYIRSSDLTFDVLNRAALSGLLQRLDFGAELVPRTSEAKSGALSGVQAELLTPQIGYLRPREFTQRETKELEQHLRDFVGKKVGHLILDLRSPAPPGNFDDAADMLSLFLPKGEVLFKMKQMGQTTSEVETNTREPVWSQQLLVLVDDETNNLGETMAAVLRQRKQALLIGSPTRGGAVRYETVPVDAEWSLRFARAEVLLTDDSSVFKKGLQPDFAIFLLTTIKRQVYHATDAKDVKESIIDKPRPRFNEAALVANTNPELDSYLKRSAGEALPEDEARPSDTVLQRAVDLITTRTLFQSAKIDWKRKASGNQEPPARRAIPVTK